MQALGYDIYIVEVTRIVIYVSIGVNRDISVKGFTGLKHAASREDHIGMRTVGLANVMMVISRGRPMEVAANIVAPSVREGRTGGAWT